MTDIVPTETVAVSPKHAENHQEQEAAESEPQQVLPEGEKPVPDAHNIEGETVQCVEEPEGETVPDSADHKRKHTDLEAIEEDKAAEQGVGESVPVETAEVDGDLGASDGSVQNKGEVVQDVKVDGADEAGDPKRQKLDHQQPDGLVPKEETEHSIEGSVVGNGQVPSTDNLPNPVEDEYQKTDVTTAQQEHVATEVHGADLQSRKVDIPNNKVGVLIGKSGDTIRYLQYNSGAKIQITRDSEVDPDSSTRPVELVGTLESLDKAEQLIKDVIAEAEAGGSPNLVARGIGLHSGAEQLEIRVPNEKVGVIIGKRGEMIKNLQTRSGARIQLIPQHLPEGDTSKERTVRISGNKKQIEAAADLVKEVMSQTRPSSLFSGYGRARGQQHPNWGPRAMAPNHPPSGFDYQQRGPYPSQNQYPQPYGGGYQQHPPPRGNYSGGWEQRPYQAPPQSGGYGYYGQGGPPMDNSQTSGSAPGGAAAAPPNYYGQPQGSGYPQQTTQYPQPGPAQPSYGQGYNEPPKYDGQAPNQQAYGQQPVASNPGQYPQQGAAQPTYQQPPYDNKPAYGAPPQGQQTYGPGGGYTGNQVYPTQNVQQQQQQQQYPYGAAAPTQQYGGAPVTPAQTYGGTAGAPDVYAQQTSAPYPQQGQVAPGYTQTAPVYAQPGQPTAVYQQGTGYSQYPAQQPTYGEQPQPVQSNAAYGYQQNPATASGYTNGAPAGYGAPPVAGGPVAYAQPTPANPATGYEQQAAPQAGYAAHPSSAPTGYA